MRIPQSGRRQRDEMVQKEIFSVTVTMGQRAFKNLNNCLNTNNYSYLETSSGQSFHLYLNVVQFFNTSVN
jgi:hypothetical protein